MPLEKSGSREAISRNISDMVASGHPRRQAIAAALHTADKYGKRFRGGALSAGGSAGAPPQAPTYKTAPSNINSSGFVGVPQVSGNPYALDLNTGALSPQAQQALQQFAMRGLPGGPNGIPPPAAPAAPVAPAAAPILEPSGNAFGTLAPPTQGGGEKRGGRIGRFAAGGADPMVGYEQRHSERMGLNRAPPMRVPSGFVHNLGAGRADTVNFTVAGGSHIIPADIVAGLGQGNGLAGAHALDHAFTSGPGGITLPHGPRALRNPAPPRPMREATGGAVWDGDELRVARGGAPGGRRCRLSGGEYIVPPDEARRVLHNGKSGAPAINEWIMERRKGDVKTIRNLAPPVGMKK